ncbi:3-phosphoshikimate 1-carboxyvinyltransferase [soil metagenome]
MIPTVRDIAVLPIADLPERVRVEPLTRPFDVTIRPPGSKSITNRALLLAALARGESVLRGALVDAEDTRAMIGGLRRLGAALTVEQARGEFPNATIRIVGVGGRWKIAPGEVVTVDASASGTTARFLTAAALMQSPKSGGIIIDGDEQLRRRPMGELVEALTQLGVHITTPRGAGRLPLHIHAAPDLRRLARRVVFTDPESSQFISALMLSAPFLPAETTLEVRGKIVSTPYVEMTSKLLQRSLGVAARISSGADGATIIMPVGRGEAFALEIEPDASGATYFGAAAALVPGARVVLGGLRVGDGESLQGDIEFLRVLKFMGATVTAEPAGAGVRGTLTALRPVNLNFAAIPDAAMTAAVLACFAHPTSDNPSATSILRGVKTLRLKESDRVRALQNELHKLGARVEVERDEGDEALRITPPAGGIICAPGVPMIALETYHDHRMAMALALVGLRRPNVEIRNPGCVAKTYPTFWRDLARLYDGVAP